MAGFSTEAILKALGGRLDALLDVIKAGKIMGVVAIVNCTILKNGPQDWVTVNLAKELVKRKVTGGAELAKLLTVDLEGLTGGKVALGDDPAKIAEDIAAHIKTKRVELGLKELSAVH